MLRAAEDDLVAAEVRAEELGVGGSGEADRVRPRHCFYLPRREWEG